VESIINPQVYAAVDQLARCFQNQPPFPHVVIDDFLQTSLAETLLQDFPPVDAMNRSRHYLFANKYELSHWRGVSPQFESLCQEILSEKFQNFCSQLYGQRLLIDARYYGDLHQSKTGGYLDMHVDANGNPYHATWLRRMNVLIYLNKTWQNEYHGELRLRLGTKGTSQSIAPLFNRCVIMQSDETTYHGYEHMTLPAGVTRKSIAIHLYKEDPLGADHLKRTTTWSADQKSFLKQNIAKVYSPLILLKNRYLGSSTFRNHQLAQLSQHLPNQDEP
jgi:Rps23 Pro-64 3,4-dihydroxylase Tpa1-like proline 4-hydroxylase